MRNLIRRFVEVGVPGYHIEDQKPGVKKCGHQGGKVLVSENEQIQRLNAARFQLDVMRVPGIIVARTDAEAASLLDGCADERDQPFILGVTNLDVPSYKAVFLAIQRKFHDAGVDEVRGHMMFAMSDAEYAAANAWLETRPDCLPLIRDDCRSASRRAPMGSSETTLDKVVGRFLDAWQEAADLKTYRQAVAEVIAFRISQGESFELNAEEWLDFSKRASWYAAREKARADGNRSAVGAASSPRRLRATTRCRAAWSTPSPSRWPPRRSPTFCGWKPPPRICTRPKSSPTPFTPNSPTRCWRTTCRHRSTGTPPA